MSDVNKSSVPILIIIVCAGFSMIVDTISSSIKIMGYDEVIQADAKARAAKILGNATQKECAPQIDQSIINQVNENTLIIEALLEDTHPPAK